MPALQSAPTPRPDVHESLWLAALDSVDPDAEVVPGVTNADLRRFHTRPRTPAGARFRLRVRYAAPGGRPLSMSLYARSAVSERRPAVIFVHGGGWCSGDPYMHIRHAHGLAARGYVSATIGYRLYPEVQWPAPLEDAKAAVRWIRANAARIGADPDRIVIAGGSAGAQLAEMLALTSGPHEPGATSTEVSSAVQAAVLWYPPVDLTRTRYPRAARDNRKVVEAFFGGPLAKMQQASPSYHVHPDAPPVLTMTGGADPVARLAPIRDFHTALDSYGITNRLAVFAGRSHAFDLANWADWQSCFALMAEFLDEQFEPTWIGADASAP